MFVIAEMAVVDVEMVRWWCSCCDGDFGGDD